MTTGTTGSIPSTTMPGPPAIFSYRNWTGGNGKKETTGGRTRIKWNNYSMQASASRITYNKWDIWSKYPVPPYAPNDPVMESQGCLWNPAPSLNEVGGVTDNQKNKAFTKLLSKIKGHDFNLGVELGQLTQTTGLLASNLGKLGRAALALRRGDFATAARQLGTSPRTSRLKAKDISGRWLELQYGWLPLLSTCFESMQAFEAISNGPRTKVFFASAVEGRKYDLGSPSPSIGSSPVNIKVGRRLQYEMYEELSVPRQLGLEDPLSIAWELTPWSFVIDWFFPFGNYLSNLNQIPRLKGRWLVTDFHKCELTHFYFRYVQGKYQGFRPITGITNSPNGEIKFANVSRTYSDTPPPVPLPNFSFHGINSARRFWNAVSLAHGRFLK